MGLPRPRTEGSGKPEGSKRIIRVVEGDGQWPIQHTYLGAYPSGRPNKALISGIVYYVP